MQEIQITLSAITLTGPGEDPSLPAGQVRIRASVVVTGTAALDWPALAPTLLLASGEALLPGDIAAQRNGVELTYLAPLSSEPRDLVWMLTPAQTDRPLRWRATLPPPPSRDAVLRESLAIDHVVARLETRDRVTITVRMTNRGTVPLTLTAADLTLTHGESPIAGVAVTGLTEPISAGASRDLSLSLPLSGFNQPLTLALGAQQYRLTLS